MNRIPKVSQKTRDQGTIKAKVTNVLRDGNPYAVAVSEQVQGSITFSLGRIAQVWQEKKWPSIGVLVALEDLRSHGNGWRAHKARLFRPTDEG